MASVKSEICNLALSRLGQYSSIENIDTPTKPAEIVCAKWWSHARKLALKTIMPNFAHSRRYISAADVDVPFGYSYAYRYPSDCVRFFGIGEVQDKDRVHSVEEISGNTYILCDEYSGAALPCRFVRDVNDVSAYTPEFVEELSWFLAYCVNMEITQDNQKQQYLESVIDKKKREASALNAQENPPIRKNVCRFAEAKYSNQDINSGKK